MFAADYQAWVRGSVPTKLEHDRITVMSRSAVRAEEGIPVQ